jgi:PAS domain S-box-containing protein
MYPFPLHGLEFYNSDCEQTDGWTELKPVAKDGNEVDSNWAVLCLPSGIQIRIGIDIRKSKESEEALRKNEKRLSSIFGNAAIGIVEVDSEDRIVAVNERCCDLLGYEKDELMGRTIHEITAPEDRQLSQETNDKIHRGEKGIIDYEKRYIKKDNTKIWVHVTISGVYNNEGQHIHSVGTIEDITERKLSQEAIKRSESTLKQAGMMANLGAWEFDLRSTEDMDKNPLHWSDQVYRIFGYEPGSVEITNALFFERVHPDDRVKVREAVSLALEKRESYTVEHRIIRKDGEIRTVIENAEVIVNEGSGNLIRMIGAVQDITERKEAEESLRKKNEELTRFIYTVSHDLKSPLVTIKSFSNYLEEDIQNKDKTALDRDLNFIRKAADRMARLLDELLELSRIGRKEKPKVNIPLSEVISTATELVAGRLDAKSIRVEVTGPPVMLYGHVQRFIQLYQNLIDNSAKFIGDQPEPLIEAGAIAGENNEVVLFVRDNGIGIDPRYHHKIFGLFEKMDVNTDGTGIGLALVKRIIEVHGGTIWFSSDVNSTGTTFYFTLEGASIIK